jgi:ankyrin repeat protein
MFAGTRTLAAALAIAALLGGCASGPKAPTASAEATADVSATAVPVIDDRPLEDQMRSAINAGDVALVEALVAAGADLDHDYGNEMRALHLAVNAQSAEVVEALVLGGADVDATIANGDTPLLQSANFNSGAVTRVLIRNGADATLLSREGFRQTPLHRAARLDNVEVLTALIEEGVDVDLAPEGTTVTALVVAAFWGSPQSAEVLILAGADLTWADDEEGTMLAMARRNGNLEVAALLEAAGAPE